MRILVHDYAGHPFQAQLSRELARRGHVVTHAFRARIGGRSGALERVPGDPVELAFHPIVLSPRAAQFRGLLARVRHERAYGKAAAVLVGEFRPDVVISANTPLLVQRSLLRRSRRDGRSFVYWMQDRISVAQARKLRHRLGVFGAPAGAALHRLERASLVGADAIVAVSPQFKVALRELGVPDERVTVVANWAPLDEIVPVARNNEWAVEHGLVERIVFLYAGSLGLKHSPDLLVKLAQELPNSSVVVVAEGSGATYVATLAARLELSNVRILPSQPYGRLSEVLGTADVLVALLDPQGGTYSVPSKVLSYLCAGRPLLASLPLANPAAQVIIDSGGGVVVEPGSGQDWLVAARELAADEGLRERLAREGREYALRTFDIARIADEFELVFDRAVTRS